jgi:CBS domain-containing protein
MTPSHCDRFLNAYNQLDELLRARLVNGDRKISQATLIDQLAKSDPLVHAMASRLHAFRALRNALVHISASGETEPIATPLGPVVEEYERHVEYLRSPPTALQAIAIPADLLYTVAWSTPVAPALEHMLAHSYRLAPIVSEQDMRLLGVFTESTLWQALQAGRGSLHVEPSTTFATFQDFCSLQHDVLGVVLMPASVTIHEVEQEFQRRFARNLLTSAVFLTDDGRPGSRLHGLITAHDLPSVNPNASQSMLDRLVGPRR